MMRWRIHYIQASHEPGVKTASDLFIYWKIFKKKTSPPKLRVTFYATCLDCFLQRILSKLLDKFYSKQTSGSHGNFKTQKIKSLKDLFWNWKVQNADIVLLYNQVDFYIFFILCLYCQNCPLQSFLNFANIYIGNSPNDFFSESLGQFR